MAPAGLFFFFLLILPLIVVIIYSFGARAAAGGYAPAFTLRELRQPSGARPRLPQHADAWRRSARLLTALIAYPLAYFLAVRAE